MPSPKQQVVALLKAIETGEAAPVAAINPARYVQHNLAAADGLAGFGALLQALPAGTARANTRRAFQDGDFVFTHTEVDPSFEGQGIGGRLVRGALDDVRRRGGRVVARCEFVRAWLNRHADYQDLLS